MDHQASTHGQQGSDPVAATVSTIFVVGAGRSGTTLLRLILDAHSKVYAGPEDQLALVHLLRWHRIDPSASRFVHEVFGFDTASGPLVELWGLAGRRTELENRLATPSARVSFADMVSVLQSMVLESKGRGATIWCIKTPHYVLYPSVMEAAAPRALVIHLVRDGRDVARSFLEGPLRGQIDPPTYRAAAQYWRHCVRSGEQTGRRFPGRYLKVRYEDLVQQPQSWIAEICARSGIAMEPAMLEHEKGNRSLEKISARERGWHQVTSRPIDPSRVGRGAVSMSSSEARDFTRVAGRELVEQGYRLSNGEQPSGRLLAGVRSLRSRIARWRRGIPTLLRWFRRLMRFRLLGKGLDA